MNDREEYEAILAEFTKGGARQYVRRTRMPDTRNEEELMADINRGLRKALLESRLTGAVAYDISW